MQPLWNSGLNGKDIATLLGFGEEGKYQYLHLHHIYIYRQRFGFTKRYDRAHYPHRYKFGKQQEPIFALEFLDKIEALPDLTFHQRRKRAFNIAIFYSGLRQTEWRILLRKNIKIEGERIVVSAFRLKKGNVSRDEATRPIVLRTYWRLIPELIEWINQFQDNERIFSLSQSTAWNYVKSVYPMGYPHYYRLNKITEMCNNTKMSILEIRNWTHLHLSTIEKYMSQSERYVDQASEKMEYPREDSTEISTRAEFLEY